MKLTDAEVRAARAASQVAKAARTVAKGKGRQATKPLVIETIRTTRSSTLIKALQILSKKTVNFINDDIGEAKATA